MTESRHKFSETLRKTYGWKPSIEKTKNNDTSLVLNLFAFGIFLIRFTWLAQAIKFVVRLCIPSDSDIPPVVIELYLILSLLIEFASVIAIHFDIAMIRLSAEILAVICIWKIIENISSNIYYLLLRPVLQNDAPHSTARSFMMAVLSLIEVWLLVCLTWFFAGKTAPQFDSILTAIYFATTTFFTVGYGEISPSGNTSRLLAIFTMFCANTMLVVVLGRALSLLRPLPNARDGERE